MSQSNGNERLGIAGTGAIACGLARAATGHMDVMMWARSDDSASRARDTLTPAAPGVEVFTDLSRLADATVVVESVVESHDVKDPLLEELGKLLHQDALLASTTSSLSVEKLAAASGRPESFAGLHVFNPVDKMKLVELAFAATTAEPARERFFALCDTLGKTAIEVPDVPGFVVNRLLFPFLFEAVRLLDVEGVTPEAIDRCMQLGARHPMGPLKLLDFVGLDVATSIGEQIGVEIPQRVRDLMAEGKLGQKTGAGFYEYPGG
jgi:3-hydroxybutyryl-CoA dehydrogenase